MQKEEGKSFCIVCGDIVTGGKSICGICKEKIEKESRKGKDKIKKDSERELKKQGIPSADDSRGRS